MNETAIAGEPEEQREDRQQGNDPEAAEHEQPCARPVASRLPVDLDIFHRSLALHVSGARLRVSIALLGSPVATPSSCYEVGEPSLKVVANATNERPDIIRLRPNSANE
jgi:hypothetical protein